MHDRLDGSFRDRPLQLELFEGPGAHRDLLQPSLDGIELLSDQERREHQEDAETDDDREDEKEKVHAQTLMSVILRIAVKPMNIMTAPVARRIWPMSSVKSGCMNSGLMKFSVTAMPIGRNATR